MSSPLPSTLPGCPIVKGGTELLFVVADPVAQVKAPALLNQVFADHGVDAVAVPVALPAAALAGFVDAALAARNVRGLLASIPHKPALARLLPRLDDAARVAGAVNAVRRAPDGCAEGALFDGSGFVQALRRQGVNTGGRRVLLVGAGGAGLAIAAALAAGPLAELAVFDSDAGRAAALAARLGSLASAPLRVAPSSDPAGFDLVVQATPLGLRVGDPLPLDPSRLSPGAVVVDILMTDHPTPLLAACRARGTSAHSGHEMLVQQMPDYLAYFGFGELAAALRADAGALQRLRRLIAPSAGR